MAEINDVQEEDPTIINVQPDVEEAVLEEDQVEDPLEDPVEVVDELGDNY